MTPHGRRDHWIDCLAALNDTQADPTHFFAAPCSAPPFKSMPRRVGKGNKEHIKTSSSRHNMLLHRRFLIITKWTANRKTPRSMARTENAFCGGVTASSEGNTTQRSDVRYLLASFIIHGADKRESLIIRLEQQFWAFFRRLHLRWVRSDSRFLPILFRCGLLAIIGQKCFRS